jgi:hypothetical protein
MQTSHKYYYSEKLKLRYRQHGDGILFEDRTTYTAEELRSMTSIKLQDDEIRTIHTAKRMFDGIICASVSEQ